MDLTPVELQKAGWEALKNQLGLVGALRFLLQSWIRDKILNYSRSTHWNNWRYVA